MSECTHRLFDYIFSFVKKYLHVIIFSKALPLRLLPTIWGSSATRIGGSSIKTGCGGSIGTGRSEIE